MELQNFKENIYKINRVSKLVINLQKERGLSSGYLGSRGKNFPLQLKKVRQKVDDDYKKLTRNEKLLNIRQEIDNLSISTIESFSFYTKIINKFQMQYIKIDTHINDPYLLKQLQSYIYISLAKEALGQMRGAFNGVFSKKNGIDKKLLYDALHAKGMYDSSIEQFYAASSDRFSNQLHAITTTKEYIDIEHIVDRYSSLNITHPTENPQKWFLSTTNIINKISTIEKSQVTVISNYIQHKFYAIKLQIASEFSFLFFILILSLWLNDKIKNSLLRSISLLSQYKEAVDRSSIVSKTDKSGIITYTNEKFCDISGYSRKELIGKPHKIVRHPDMSKSTFKELWQTILAKKAWSGIIKNRTKNGGYYIVEATINPILNHKGEIEEFIAIRNDITDVAKLNDDLEHTQEELLFRIGEIEETRSSETGFHIKRVAKYSQLLAKLYGLEEKDIRYLTVASPMHDIGKVGIPDGILQKPGKLNDDEWNIMKTHVDIGYKLFRDSDKPLLKAASIIAYEHHEKYDGSGYPRGIKGEKIHIYGRITALADVFDALGSDRCYKKAWDEERIFALLRAERGRHFDPKLVDIFFEHLDKFLYIRDEFREESAYMKEHQSKIAT